MISVIIPVYHNEATLMKSLNYLDEQPYINETILVFDGYKPDSYFSDSMYSYLKGTKVIANYPDIPWGNARARNLGAINANNNLLLFLDVDHTFKKRITGHEHQTINANHNTVLRFKRDYEGRTEWPSGSILLHRDSFFGVGGYNEKFCGNYGYEDIELLWRLEQAGIKIINSEIEIDVMPEGRVILPRDVSVNRKLFTEIRDGI